MTKCKCKVAQRLKKIPPLWAEEGNASAESEESLQGEFGKAKEEWSIHQMGTSVSAMSVCVWNCFSNSRPKKTWLHTHTHTLTLYTHTHTLTLYTRTHTHTHTHIYTHTHTHISLSVRQSASK